MSPQSAKEQDEGPELQLDTEETRVTTTSSQTDLLVCLALVTDILASAKGANKVRSPLLVSHLSFAACILYEYPKVCDESTHQ